MAEGCTSIEFLASDGPDRAKQCRKLANAADALATNASPEMQAGYLDLKRQWNMLADDIEREEESQRADDPSRVAFPIIAG
jgi:hypothetical protein